MAILLRLLRFAYKYKLFTLIGYLCLIGTIILNLVQPLIFRQVIDVDFPPSPKVAFFAPCRRPL